jgi:hypothetical protein
MVTRTAAPNCLSSVAGPVKEAAGCLDTDAGTAPVLKRVYWFGHGNGNGGSWNGEEGKADNSAEDGRAGEHVGGCFGTELAVELRSRLDIVNLS